jgi:hypothetical protein
MPEDERPTDQEPQTPSSHEDQKQKQNAPRRFLDSITAMSTDSDPMASARFWRKQKLGSGEYSLQDRNVEAGSGEGEGGGSLTEGVSTEYRTYKRRWFGLAQLTLMNIIVSWDVSLPRSPTCTTMWKRSSHTIQVNQMLRCGSG